MVGNTPFPVAALHLKQPCVSQVEHFQCEAAAAGCNVCNKVGLRSKRRS